MHRAAIEPPVRFVLHDQNVTCLTTPPDPSRHVRMEELSVSLGRITPARRLADVHVSDSTAVSHLHAQIEFRVHHNHYVLVNHAHNGTKLKTIESDDWTEVRTAGCE